MAYTKINISGISARIQRASASAQAKLCERVLADSAEYVPYRTGKLCSSGKVGVNSVSWTADYARECYYAERTFSKKAHPKATARWFEAAKSANLAAWENEMKRMI